VLRFLPRATHLLRNVARTCVVGVVYFYGKSVFLRSRKIVVFIQIAVERKWLPENHKLKFFSKSSNVKVAL